VELIGLKVNVGKTKLIVAGKKSRSRVKSGRWPCSCCKIGVVVN